MNLESVCSIYCKKNQNIHPEHCFGRCATKVETNKHHQQQEKQSAIRELNHALRIMLSSSCRLSTRGILSERDTCISETAREHGDCGTIVVGFLGIKGVHCRFHVLTE